MAVDPPHVHWTRVVAPASSLTPLEAIRLERGIANSTLFMIRNAGHFPWLQQRDIFFKNFTQAARVILKRRL
jgi:pimeloyl-ACP methyl ester carboxylesterase